MTAALIVDASVAMGWVHPGQATAETEGMLEAVAEGLTVEERAFTLEEAYGAREAFITSASQIVLPVVRVDGRPIGDGKPGPVAITLRRAYRKANPQAQGRKWLERLIGLKAYVKL